MMFDFAKEISKQVNRAFESLGKEIDQISRNRILEYEVNSFKKYSEIKTLIFRNISVDLMSIYVPMRLGFDSPPSRLFEERKNEIEIDTEDIRNILEQGNKLTIIGNAGVGKSTLLNYIFLQSIRKGIRIPIKINLRDIDDGSVNLFTYLESIIFDRNKIATSEQLCQRLLENGEFIILFDGFDELSHNILPRITKEIDELSTRYSNNIFIITSRPHSGANNIYSFKSLKLIDLDEVEQDLFVKKNTEKIDKDFASNILDSVKLARKNSSYSSYLSNPLLLSMYIVSFRIGSDLPTKRNSFYSRVFRALAYEHDAFTKMNFIRNNSSGLKLEEVEEILMVFCFISFIDEKFKFSQDFLFGLFKKIKNIKKLSFDDTRLFRDLIINYCILIKEGNDISFPHRSLQEYFAAKFISEVSSTSISKYYSAVKLLNSKKRNEIGSLSNFNYLLSELDRINYLMNILPETFDDYLEELKYVQLELKDGFFRKKNLRFYHDLMQARMGNLQMKDKISELCIDLLDKTKELFSLFDEQVDYPNEVQVQVIGNSLIVIKRKISGVKRVVSKLRDNQQKDEGQIIDLLG